MFKNAGINRIFQQISIAREASGTTVLNKWRAVLDLLLLVTLPLVCAHRPVVSAVSYSIELQEFRWTRFPLKVFVDINEWSLPDYAVAVREAVDSWMKSVWNYTHTFNDTSLPTLSYVYYVGGINLSSNYDVFVSFTPTKIPPDSNTVGLTTYSWEMYTHEPIPPIRVNITTFSATASNLFVKNVVMHEFGHVLGLGHASSTSTLNGPELMYYISSKDQVVYPSTLDIYGLTMLYHDFFRSSVELPADIPYVMLAEGTVTQPTIGYWDDYRPYIVVFAIFLTLIAVAVVAGRIGQKQEPQQTLEQPSSPTAHAKPKYNTFVDCDS